MNIESMHTPNPEDDNDDSYGAEKTFRNAEKRVNELAKLPPLKKLCGYFNIKSAEDEYSAALKEYNLMGHRERSLQQCEQEKK